MVTMTLCALLLSRTRDIDNAGVISSEVESNNLRGIMYMLQVVESDWQGVITCQQPTPH